MGSRLSISQRYLKKLSISEKLTPTLANLKILLAHHILHIPFGNISSFLGYPVSLEPADIAEKLLDQGREGYCLEHSTLTREVLNELGYQAFNLLGRVYYQSQPTEAPIRTHLVTVVKLDGHVYLFDPGFGGVTPTAVLALSDIDISQDSAHEPFRFITVEDSGIAENALSDMKIMLQVFVRNEWTNVYALNPEQSASPSDALIANWFISTAPLSLFTQNLMITTVNATQRINLSGTTVRIHGKDSSSKKILTQPDEFKGYLESVFKINTSNIDIDALFNKLTLG